MGKKIVLMVFGGIALLGLVVTIVGFAMGGLPGSLSVSNGQLVYHSGNTTVPLFQAPNWASRWQSYYDNLPSSGTHGSGSSHTTATPPGDRVEIYDTVKAFYVDISAGYLVLQAGDEASLTVDGPLPYTQDFNDDGEWHLSAWHEGISSRWDGGWGRNLFWLAGQDVTTTFTVTLPADMLEEVAVTIGMGDAKVSGFTLKGLDCHTDMGAVTVKDTTAQNARFDANMGGIEVTGFSGETCRLITDMGAIDFSGEVTNFVDADCSMGSIRATLPRPDDYGWKAEASLGAVTIDGRGTGGLQAESSGGNPDAHPFFELECGMGNIEIIFN